MLSLSLLSALPQKVVFHHVCDGLRTTLAVLASVRMCYLFKDDAEREPVVRFDVVQSFVTYRGGWKKYATDLA